MKKLLQLVGKETSAPKENLLLLAGITGLSNTLVLVVINAAVGEIAQGTHNFRYLVMFVLTMTVHVLGRKALRATATTEIETAIHKIRTRIADKIGRADLLPLERIGRSEVEAVLNRDMTMISQSAGTLVQAGQSAMVVTFTMLYIAWLSTMAFILFTVVVFLAIWIYMIRKKEIESELREAMLLESRVVDGLNEMVNGFKEVKLSTARYDALSETIDDRSTRAKTRKIHVGIRLATLGIFAQATIYVGMAAMVFVLPQFSPELLDAVMKLTTAVLFIASPLTNVVGSISDLADANVASANVERMEALLDSAALRPAQEPGAVFDDFEEISFQDVTFHYGEQPGQASFTVGPLDCVIPAGTMIFLAGSNGSGKTTFLKLLTALYQPAAGVIRIDGDPVDAFNLAAYRNLFSVIFQDFFLFERPYGTEVLHTEDVTSLLRRMGLEHKTKWVDGAFDNLKLSTGQRKRLALIHCLLEDKPIFILDEWAADQDPVFRDWFYVEFLPEMKRRAKTVIAVTHDDRYYHLADQIWRMRDGRIVISEAERSTTG